MMGCFYIGYDFTRQDIGYCKIGESNKSTPSQRAFQIRKQEPFQILKYLKLIDESRAQRLFVESYVRMKLSMEIENTKNDHFYYDIHENETIEETAEDIAKTALDYAIEACEMANILYSIGKHKYKKIFLKSS